MLSVQNKNHCHKKKLQTEAKPQGSNVMKQNHEQYCSKNSSFRCLQPQGNSTLKEVFFST